MEFFFPDFSGGGTGGLTPDALLKSYGKRFPTLSPDPSRGGGDPKTQTPTGASILDWVFPQKKAAETIGKGISEKLGITKSDATESGGKDTSISGTVQNLFGRGIVVILGFIFVAVGLSMLIARNTNVGQGVVREVLRSRALR